eukprot:scaffold289_cov147-Amphora_coffeaeformis.AAC.1
MSFAALGGGALIGSSAATLLLFSGDILGASGFCSTIGLEPKKILTDPSQHWKLVFLSTFMLTSSIYLGSGYDKDHDQLRMPSILAYCIGGICTGFGTKLSNGCTTGHGMCGMARLSKRSIVAVLTFMSTAVATTTLLTSPNALLKEYSGFLRDYSGAREGVLLPMWSLGLTVASVAAALVAPLLHSKKEKTENEPSHMAKIGPAAVAGSLFARGLYMGGMIYRDTVLGFLDVSQMAKGMWNPTLMFVMAGGMVVSFTAYQFLEKHRVFQSTASLKKPLLQPEGTPFGVPTNQVIDRDLLLGAALFGIGWAIGCICPGQGMFNAAVGVRDVIYYWWPTYFLGAKLATLVKSAGPCPTAKETKQA